MTTPGCAPLICPCTVRAGAMMMAWRCFSVEVRDTSDNNNLHEAEETRGRTHMSIRQCVPVVTLLW